ncbi:DUF523 domain-containing protein [Enterovibrio sp. ZSDZ35]|uniref:DUF523 domain-containing protein n=1 Tax=Enterovibrio qingdaonensis TaxID=2899818 RepID=A0ABT5QG75_9GAMM|nr:DUF523 domain-containing protein [Enterovibrio sp. ZSDZ35]MDD1779978.1 DUF523 domain-containing protein [Enterovibrio sp. ZSDZ35]
MEKILISACLYGNKVRYNGSDLKLEQCDLDRLNEVATLIAFCPEVAGGLPTPRPPAEILPADGDKVLEGTAVIRNTTGIEVTEAFVTGAQQALALCQQHKIKYALLTESSPSCGSSLIYNGNFEGQKIEGQGITTALLRRAGIEVFSQFTLSTLLERLTAPAKNENHE